MTSHQIRQKFLDFFQEKDHRIVSSDLLVPKDDPTLLFTGAGMNQFKEQFMGRNITFKRAASCQKCLRTGDLENVGKTPRHHTFFEMLGNFSFGDYFKTEAISWAWEFMTSVMGLAEEKLWVSVYEEDLEAYEIWLKDIKVPEEKIVKLGEHDNFWPADAPSQGPNGPCGPCSEIFYDWGEDIGCGKASCSPACECGRFVEVWNLVFTEFDRKPDGTLEALPNKNIDTGMGLERMASVMQNVRTNFETDLFVSVIEREKEILGDIGASDLNLIADHVRAATFSIADGVSPSNEKRGYVVRKLIRRAWLKGEDKKEPFLYNLVPLITGMFKDVYPEVDEKREHIAAIIEEEERRFNDTIQSALPVLEEMLSGGEKVLSGENIFKLADTYGMPVEVISDICAEREVKVELDKFDSLMNERKTLSRKGSDLEGEFIFQPDKFTGAPKPEYSDKLPLKAKIEFLVKEGSSSSSLEKGDEAELITSPQSSIFYAEAGGQVGDSGIMTSSAGRITILDTYETDGRKVYHVRVDEGSFKKGDSVTLDLDEEKKSRTAKNHTATHLLQAALRGVLGNHIKQSGSLVDHRHLRFDFTHMKKLSDRELLKVEDRVNECIASSIGVSKKEKTLKEAKGEGALSFFGEKYADTVRVVSIGDESKELCGGTHVENTKDIGLFKITSESSVASGIRRIEAVTGEAVEEWMKRELKKVTSELIEKALPEEEKDSPLWHQAQGIITGSTKVDKDIVREFDEKIMPELTAMRSRLEKEAKRKEKDLQAGKFSEVKLIMDDALEETERAGKVDLISCVFTGVDMSLLRKAASYLEKKAGSKVAILASEVDGKAYLACSVSADLVSRGITAKEIIFSAAKHIGGSGGGKDTFAQAGGDSPEGIKEAIEEVKNILEKKG